MLAQFLVEFEFSLPAGSVKNSGHFCASACLRAAAGPCK